MSSHVACGTSQTSADAVAESIGTSSQALTSTPSYAEHVQTNTPDVNGITIQQTIRPVVTAGRDYVYLTDAGNLHAYKRHPDGTISLADQPWESSLVDIFATQIPVYNFQAHTINQSDPQTSEVPDCNYSDISYLDVKAPNVPNPLPTAGCAKAAYDGDTIYDEYSGHVFVMTKILRPVYTCDSNNGPGGTGWWNGAPGAACNFTTDTSYPLDMAARPIMVAVSKCNAFGEDCENPANGWNTYTLAELYADWAQIMVARGLVMVNYHDVNTYLGYSPLGSMWVYRASDLINGNLPFIVPEAAPFSTTKSSFQTASKTPLGTTVMFTKMHSPTSNDYPILVTLDQGNMAAFNIVPTDPGYLAAAAANPQGSPALWDLSPWITSLTLSGEGTTPLPAGLGTPFVGQQLNAHPVWSAASTGTGTPGALYWSFVNGTQGISAFQWPFTAAPLSQNNPAAQTPSMSTGAGFIGWNVAVGGGVAYDFPVLEHNEMTGDTVLLFHTFTNGISAPLESSQYVAAGPNQQFFAPVNIATASGVGNTLASKGGTVDILSNVSDPIRPQVFMTSVASNGAGSSGGFNQWMTAVPMLDPLIPPAIQASPNQLSIPVGGAASTTINFPGPTPASLGIPLPTCTAGGDLGPPQGVQVSPTGNSVTVAIQVPPTLSPGSYFEGISCTNGVAVTIPVTATAATFYASPPSITLSQGGVAPYVYFEFSDPSLEACTTGYAVLPGVAPGLTASLSSNALQISASSTLAPGQYVVEVGTSGCAYDSNAAVTVNVIPYVCQPEAYCTNQGVEGGVQCGTVPDGCGGYDYCGACQGSGEICSSGYCCPTGTTYNSNVNACTKYGGGGGGGGAGCARTHSCF